MKEIYRVSIWGIRIETRKVNRETESTYFFDRGNERKKGAYHEYFEKKEDAIKFIGNRLIREKEISEMKVKEIENKIREYETLYKL